MEKKTFSIPNITCGHCVMAIQNELNELDGIKIVEGNPEAKSIDVGWAYPILQLTGVLNVAIAITNLLPLPALDGGRIFFILLEAIRGKPVSSEREGMVHGIGLMILLLVLVVITIQDIVVPMPQGFNWADYLY